jgi:hypothetical protein
VDKYLFDRLAENNPKMNELICAGIVTEQLKHTESYVDEVLRCASSSFIEGFEYVSYRQCTPYEEFNEQTRERYSKRIFEMSKSNFYMISLNFRFMGKDLPPRYMYLPYVNDAGLMTVNGSQFVVNPVLTDKVFSVDHETIFMPITRDKLIFERITHSFLVDEERRHPSVVWGHIHKVAKRKTTLSMSNGLKVKPVTTIPHYLFAKYGVTETFKRFYDTDIIAGGIEINRDAYPEKEWVICRSRGIKPLCVTGVTYSPPDLRIAIRRTDYSERLEPLLGGLFYLADLFPSRVAVEWIDSTVMWQILLGICIYKNGESEGKLLTYMATHLDSLDEYVDTLVKKNLSEEDVFCDNIYELFVYIMDNMTQMLISAEPATMYGKRLTILRYLLLDFVISVFNLTYALKRKANSIDRELTESDVRKILDKTIKINAVSGSLTTESHGEVNTMAYPGDNKIFKITSRAIPQSHTTGKKQSTSLLSDPGKHLHSSIAEVGSYGNQPKFDPTGQSRLNPFLNVGVDGNIKRAPEHKEILDSVQERISRS